MLATQNQQSKWLDACLIAQLITINPRVLGGIWFKSSAGPVRDQWFTFLQNSIAGQIPYRKIPPQTDELALMGGIDIFQTLQFQKKVYSQGILEQINEGILVLTMAERLERHTAALITQAFDLNQFGLVAIDESIHSEEEQLLPRIQDRLAFMIQLDDLSYKDCQIENIQIDVLKIRNLSSKIEIPELALEAIITAANGLGIHSIRAISFAIQASKSLAALRGSDELSSEDIRTATRLVFSHRLRTLPKEKSEEENISKEEPQTDSSPESQEDISQNHDSSDQQSQNTISKEQLEDMIIEASKAYLPQNILEFINNGKSSSGSKNQEQGKLGEQKKGAQRGLRLPSRQVKFDRSKKIDLLKTIQAAIPWQTIRNSQQNAINSPVQLKIQAQDIYLKQFMQRSTTVTLFVVDASGSSAKERLGEAKGAVELLLAQCYIRRDQVAMMTFRANKVDLTLAPTRSLVRAKRMLSAMPGGGGTPFAKAIQSSVLFAKDLRKKGHTPLIIFLTDGRANVSLAGIGGREQAYLDCLQVAKNVASENLQILFVDTSFKVQESNQSIARQMNAKYILLPQGKSSAVVQATKTLLT